MAAALSSSPSNMRMLLDTLIHSHHVVVFSKTYCPYCKTVKDLFDSLHVQYKLIELDVTEHGSLMQEELKKMTGQSTVPNVFIHSTHVGGCDDTLKAQKSGRLAQLLAAGTTNMAATNGHRAFSSMTSPAATTTVNHDKGTTALSPPHYDYDVIVIGAGSGGISCARESSRLGKKVAIFDYIVPTPLGTAWGLGGTCVNVGCIPKKLMHNASLLKEHLNAMPSFGWENIDPAKVTHRWETLVNNVQDYIHSLNFGYRVQLRDLQIDYHNALAHFSTSSISPSQDNGIVVHATFFDRKTRLPKEEKSFTARHVVIAVGGRPRYPDIPGAREYCITSDDLFSLKTPPGRTLVVGASYVALECAGFLTGLGFDVTLMVRSIFLRGFDQQMAEKVADYMKNSGTKFLRPAVPQKIEKMADGKLKVTWLEGGTQTKTDLFDTVLLAIGRDPLTSSLGVREMGIKLHPTSGKIITKADESTNIPNVYAVGDVGHMRPELTPVAIEAGKLLARRLFGGSTRLMDYTRVTTTVFTPLEYGACGLSEEDAIATFGENDIEVFHSNLRPLEWSLPHWDNNACYMKLICHKSDDMRVVGLHLVTPNAGEIAQGYAVAIKANATKEDFENTIYIHPTVAEEVVKLRITKSSGEDATVTNCCG